MILCLVWCVCARGFVKHRQMAAMGAERRQKNTDDYKDFLASGKSSDAMTGDDMAERRGGVGGWQREEEGVGGWQREEEVLGGWQREEDRVGG